MPVGGTMPPGMRAYSMDLRERIVAAVDAGLHQAQAAERFGVSQRTVERYLARRRRTGSLAATEEAKSLPATERDETARARWRAQMGTLDPARLVFVDECGTHTSMTRRRARAARGARARGAVPRNRGPVTPLLAGVSPASDEP